MFTAPTPFRREVTCRIRDDFCAGRDKFVVEMREAGGKMVKASAGLSDEGSGSEGQGRQDENRKGDQGTRDMSAVPPDSGERVCDYLGNLLCGW